MTGTEKSRLLEKLRKGRKSKDVGASVVMRTGGRQKRAKRGFHQKQVSEDSDEEEEEEEEGGEEELSLIHI